MENVKPSTLVRICGDLFAAGNNSPLRLEIGRDAEGTPWKATVKAGGKPLFDLPIETEPPIPDDTPPSAPNADVEKVKQNVLGWLNMALKEAARLNVPGRTRTCDTAMSEIQNAAAVIRRFVC